LNFSLVKQSLNHVEAFLKPVTQQKLIELKEKESIISWTNRKPGIYNEVYYPIEYQCVIDARQYSLLLNDGSFFQFFYDFNLKSKKLEKAKLAFYPSPIDSRTSLDELNEAAELAFEYNEEHYNHLDNWIDLLEIKKYFPANTSQVRFDYDDGVTSHEKAHLQFSSVNKLRLPADFFPLPYAFVLMVSDLINGCSSIDKAHMNFTRRHGLKSNVFNRIISLKSQ
jgi:hypothetical protein